MKRVALAALGITALLLGCLVVGTTWHEVVGHGLTGVLLGGRLEYVHIVTVRFSPGIEWRGWQGAYGFCDVTGVPTPTRERLMELAGSMSTWCMSVLAVGLLWLRRWRGWMRWVLIGLSIWWIDLMTYLLPSWGIRRSILWGGAPANPIRRPRHSACPAHSCRRLASSQVLSSQLHWWYV